MIRLKYSFYMMENLENSHFKFVATGMFFSNSISYGI